MKINFLKPRNELSKFVNYIWIFESPAGMPDSDTNLAVPNGSPKLVINCENILISSAEGRAQKSSFQGVYFAGNRDVPVYLSTPPGKTSFIGIEFFPQGAYSIFGIPMMETTNQRISLEELLDSKGRRFIEKLANIGSIEGKINFIQDKMLESLVRVQLRRKGSIWDSSIVDFCINSLKSTNGLMSISDLECKTGYSIRYLELLFKTQVGYSPKNLAGIYRFQKFYMMWATGKSYSQIKDELYKSYYDQSHFVKEFKNMTGFAPKHFTSKISNEFGRQLSLH